MVALAAPGISVASPAPSWAVGTFHGYSRELSGDIEVTVSASGASSRVLYRGGRRVEATPGYHQDGKLVFAGARYKLERWNDGIRLTREGESSNYVNCSRGSIDQGTSGGFGGSGGSSTVPSWAVGTFSGYNDRYDQDVELSIDRNGSATLRTWTDGKQQTSRGNYRNSRLSFDKASYYLSQRGSGIRITLASNRNESVDLNRGSGGFGGSGGSGGSSSSVPSWAVGTFSGYNGRYDQDVELTISRGGSATLRTWTDGREQRSNGSYQNGRLVFDRDSYYLSQRGSGIRITLQSNRNESVDLNRGSGGFGGSGGSGGSSSSVPSWAAGTFTGYSQRHGQDVEVTITRGGAVTLRTWTDGREQKSSGSYQNGRLVFDKASYYLNQRGNGIRITLASDRSDYVDLNRNGGGFGGSGGTFWP